MNLFVTCTLVLLLQIIVSFLKVKEIKYCYEGHKFRMVLNAFYSSVVNLISFAMGVSPLIKIFNDLSKFQLIDLLIPAVFVLGSVIGKLISFDFFNKKVKKFFAMSLIYRIFVK